MQNEIGPHPDLTMKTRANHASNGEWSALNAYLRDVAKHPSLTHEESLALGAKACAGDQEARETLVKSHLKLVVKIAHQYSGFGLPLADLIAEGNLGLLRASELYNPKFGTRFLAYASVWIRQRIHRSITSQARAVRIPVWRSQRLRKLARIQEEVSSQLGRSASDEELAERLGLSIHGLSEMQGDRIEVVSIDTAMNQEEEDGRNIGDTLADPSAEDPSERLRTEELHDELLACLAELDDRELQVLALKFGLSAPSSVSFRELGRRLGVSHEWVRRIAELALVKVRRAFSESAGWSVPERKRRSQMASARVSALSGPLTLGGSAFLPAGAK
jgi:RNA polymerase primary sigma factor